MSKKRSECTTPAELAKLDRDNERKRLARVPRGPSGDHHGTPAVQLAPGLELKAQTVKINADGTLHHRYDKSHTARNEPQFETVPASHHVTKTTTRLDADGRVGMQYVTAKHDEAARERSFWSACAKHVAEYKGLADPVPTPTADLDADLLSVYVVGDAHIGMLSYGRETGEDFDLKIAEAELVRAVELLVARAPESRQATLLNVGDWFHVQGDEQRTPTSGVKLDADSRFSKLAKVGFRIMRTCIDKLLLKHGTVHVVSIPGNHDPNIARMLVIWLQAVYEREPRVTVADNDHPYSYQVHGSVLLGFAHGDGVKMEGLPGLMATDKPKEWGATYYRTWLTGHFHHQIKKELSGCTVESFRTLAPKDYWHTHKGYRAGQSMTVITYHTEYGETTRSTADIRLVRRAGVK